MRLWYQSMSRQTEWGGYPAVLRSILDKVRDPGTEIHVAGITQIGGVGDQFRYLEYLETGEVLKNVQRAMLEGYDAFLIGNIADPGLREAREIANIPVLGLCESAMHVACMMGANFSFVTINEKFTPRVVENVDRYGLRSRFVGASRMRIDRLTDLGPGFQPRRGSGRDYRPVQHRGEKEYRERRRGRRLPPVVLVMALLAHAGIHATEDNVPILNGITNIVKLGEAAVKLDRIMGGRFVSKKCAYAPPPADQIETFRKYYGQDIYPTVKAP